MTKTQLPRIKGFSGRHRKCLYSQTDECSALRLSEQNCAKVCKIRLWQPSAAQTLFLILWSTDVAYSLETCSAREEKSSRKGERERDRQAEKRTDKRWGDWNMPWWSVSVYMGQKPFQTQQKKKKGQALLAISTTKQLDLHRNHSHSLSLNARPWLLSSHSGTANALYTGEGEQRGGINREHLLAAACSSPLSWRTVLNSLAGGCEDRQTAAD